MNAAEPTSLDFPPIDYAPAVSPALRMRAGVKAGFGTRVRTVFQTVGRMGDLALSLVAPAAAFRRTLARAAFQRSYDAGVQGSRLNDGMPFSRKDADTELNGKRSTIAAHAREEIRNNGWVQRATRALANNVCGDSDVNQGIDIRPMVLNKDGSPNEAVNAELQKFWDRYKDKIEYTGRWGWTDIVRLWCNSQSDNGEYLTIIHDRPAPESDLNFSLEVIEPDRMPTSYEAFGIGPFMPLSTLPNGNFVKHSIEYQGPVVGSGATKEVNRIKRGQGQIVGIHVLQDHPGNEYLLAPNYQTFFVPWERVIHGFEASRPEQTRGISRMVSGLQIITDLRDLIESELAALRVQSYLAVHFKGKPAMPAPSGAAGAQSPVVDGNGRPVTRMERGMVTYGENEPSFFSSQRPGATIQSFIELLGRLFSSAVDMPYSIVTGDYSKLSFSSLRQEHHEFRRSCRTVQGQFVRSIKKRVWPLFVRAVALSGKSKIVTMEALVQDRENFCTCHVELPAWEYVNPQQEANADAVMLANGLKTHAEIPGATAMDPVKRLQVHAQTKTMCEGLGLNLPCFNGAKATAPDKSGVDDPDQDDKDDAASVDEQEVEATANA